MRILMLSDVYFPRINGVSSSIQVFRKELKKQGHHVTLIAPDYGGEQDDPDVIRIPSRYVPLDPEDRMMRRKAILSLARDLRGLSLDVIHVQTPFIAHYAGLELGRALGLPCVETYHTFFEEYLFHYVPFLPKTWLRGLVRQLTRRQCNQVNAVIVPSTAMAEVLRRYGVTTKISLIPTGVDLEQFNGGDGEAFRRRCGIDPDRFTLVYVGRVAHEKNIEFLLLMLDVLRRRLPDVLFIIAGEGPALAALKNQVVRLRLSQNVLFVGYLSRKDALKDCYRAGDAFVFASRTETQGLVLLEALALGVPVVSTAVMGTADVLQPGCGALIAREDQIEFAAAVERLLVNPGLRKRLSEQGPRYVKQWSAPELTERLVEFYRAVVEQWKEAGKRNKVVQYACFTRDKSGSQEVCATESPSVHSVIRSSGDKER